MMVSDLDDSRHGRKMHVALEWFEGLSKGFMETGRFTQQEADRLGMYAGLRSLGIFSKTEAWDASCEAFPDTHTANEDNQ